MHTLADKGAGNGSWVAGGPKVVFELPCSDMLSTEANMKDHAPRDRSASPIVGALVQDAAPHLSPNRTST